MRVVLSIDCDGSAFEDDPTLEVARILREAAADVVRAADVGGVAEVRLRDVNGNTVGRLTADLREDV